MFAKAYKKAIKFTRPVIISTRTIGGEVECGCGAFVLINREGWILTVAHILNSFLAFRQHKEKIDEHHSEVKKIKSNSNLNKGQKRKRIKKLEFDKKWITNHSFWWGANGVKIENFHLFGPGDIAVGKIENYKDNPNSLYPKFKNPKKLEIGTSLCKLGFPFYKIRATFDDKKGFILAKNTLPLPFFPIEGIYTRNINVKTGQKSQFGIKFLETSSPGLKGQSGGPIFDKNGVIWGIQRSTQSFSLGFCPSVEEEGEKIEENQFLNVGWGVHPEVIFDFLNHYKIRFEVAD